MIPVEGGDSVRAWVVYPERSTNAPVVVVVHEIFGLSTWVRGVADQLAADGFIGIAPDLLPPFTDDYAAVRTLEDIGESRFGRGISYHFPITPAGLVFEGVSIDRDGFDQLMIAYALPVLIPYFALDPGMIAWTIAIGGIMRVDRMKNIRSSLPGSAVPYATP